MNIIKVLKFILSSEHHHFISVDKKVYEKWKYVIILAVKLNKNYKSVEIFRKKFKVLEDFVVIGLKYNGKNVKRRTVGFAKEFIEQNQDARCLYCDSKLTLDNATADHIVPISEGGNNCQVNLVVCCKDCNNERGNLDFRYYMSIKNSKKLKYFI
jgi:CRISPR/Cas system Type II protein with McrA/HNH and RuvC-like nuclease domain